MAGGLGVIVLTGGASARMGEDKAAQLWAGYRAVDRVFQLGRTTGAAAVITVGAKGYGFAWTPDPSPLAGPVGGVLAGIATLRAAGCDRALVLAVDAPTTLLSDLQPLLAAGGGAAYEGLHVPMLLPFDAVPAEAAADWPLARLAERAGVVRLPCPESARPRLRGANTPEEKAALLKEFGLE